MVGQELKEVALLLAVARSDLSQTEVNRAANEDLDLIRSAVDDALAHLSSAYRKQPAEVVKWLEAAPVMLERLERISSRVQAYKAKQALAAARLELNNFLVSLRASAMRREFRESRGGP